MRSAILFSLRLINQLHTHSKCNSGLRCTHAHTHTHVWKFSSGPADILPGCEKALKVAEPRKGKPRLPAATRQYRISES